MLSVQPLGTTCAPSTTRTTPIRASLDGWCEGIYLSARVCAVWGVRIKFFRYMVLWTDRRSQSDILLLYLLLALLAV